MYGYKWKILKVDLSRRETQIQDIPDLMQKNFLGGSGFATHILFNELDPQTPALSAENMLVFATGPLTGTNLPMMGRHVVSAKSPLTNLWGDADAGGFWGVNLKRAGFDIIQISGASPSPLYLSISDKKTEFKDAKAIWGHDTYETEKMIKDEIGKVSVSCIGQAGENLVKYACIANEGRIAGRGGLGAVMGFKKLKAIAVQGTEEVEVRYPNEVEQLREEITEEIRTNPGARRISKYGTGGDMTFMLSYMRDLPLKNYAEDVWDVDAAAKISGKAMATTIRKSMRAACYKCVIGCEKHIEIKEGPFAVEPSRGPEYETLASLGSSCLVDDLKCIAKINDLCNRYGLDTIETGVTAAMVMECFEKGILSKEKTGIELNWGDGEALLRLVPMIAGRQGFGDLLAEGVRESSSRIGGGAEEFAMQVKGQSIPMHDPRVMPVMGLKYATLSMGAYHGKGCAAAYEGKKIVKNVIEGQNWGEVMDCLVVCSFVFEDWATNMSHDYVPRMIHAVTGHNIDLNELNQIGERIFNMKRIFVNKLGISKKDDKLPTRFSRIPRVLGQTNHLFALEPMLSEYYQERGWDENGIPTKEKLTELGISS